MKKIKEIQSNFYFNTNNLYQIHFWYFLFRVLRANLAPSASGISCLFKHPNKTSTRKLNLSLRRVLPQSNFEQVRYGVSVQLFHNIGAVCLYRFNADTQVIRNLFIQSARHNAL